MSQKRERTRHLWGPGWSLYQLAHVDSEKTAPADAPACGPCLLAARVYAQAARTLRSGVLPAESPDEAMERLVNGPFKETFYPEHVRKALGEGREVWLRGEEYFDSFYFALGDVEELEQERN